MFNCQLLSIAKKFATKKFAWFYPKFFAKVLLLFGTRKFFRKKMQNTIGFSVFNTSKITFFNHF